ncbi:MAG TPA: glycosyltransferase, partial [Ferruginibacter sp.]|nr:glycosyltransferase [Ferruginibacter sp.]
MQQALLLIILILFGLYFLLIIYYWQSWLSIPNFKLILSVAEGQTPNLKPAYRTGRPQTKITVIIPARNEESNIAACLDSVCNQSYPKDLYEVLVVDDHSTDNTAAIARKYGSQNLALITLKDIMG